MEKFILYHGTDSITAREIQEGNTELFGLRFPIDPTQREFAGALSDFMPISWIIAKDRAQKLNCRPVLLKYEIPLDLLVDEGTMAGGIGKAYSTTDEVQYDKLPPRYRKTVGEWVKVGARVEPVSFFRVPNEYLVEVIE